MNVNYIIMKKNQKTKEMVLQAIEKYWPVSVSQVANNLGKNNSISKIKYHFDTLKKNKEIKTKKIGRNLVAWPVGIEKMRDIHTMIKE